MTQDDPFADPGDFDKTVLRPNPGGRRAAAQAAPLPRGPAAGASVVPAIGVNPLVAAAAPIFGLAIRLRNTATLRDVEGLRERVIRELRAFEARAGASGASPETVRAAHYALAATVDDLVLNTPWGSHSVWTNRSMVSTFHNDVTGGERFFDILSHLHRDPGRHIQVLELMYLCLSLGFEGRFRVAPRGGSELARIRDGLYRTIREVRGEFERELSPRWRGVQAAHRPLTSYVPVWVVATVAAVLLTVMYMGFTFALNGSSDGVYANLAGLPPAGPVALARAATATPPPAVATVIPEDDALTRMRQFLAPEIEQQLVEVFGDMQSVTVRIKSEGMFASASTTVQERFLPVLRRIAEALNGEPGRVILAGHTDSIPIRTVRFPSNFHLSVARAEAVRDVMAGHLREPGRLEVEGRADTEPIDTNATPEGRERNRRIEVILVREGA